MVQGLGVVLLLLRRGLLLLLLRCTVGISLLLAIYAAKQSSQVGLLLALELWMLGGLGCLGALRHCTKEFLQGGAVERRD